MEGDLSDGKWYPSCAILGAYLLTPTAKRAKGQLDETLASYLFEMSTQVHEIENLKKERDATLTARTEFDNALSQIPHTIAEELKTRQGVASEVLSVARGTQIK